MVIKTFIIFGIYFDISIFGISLYKYTSGKNEPIINKETPLNVSKARYVVPNNNNKYLIGIFFLDLKYKI